MVRPIQKNRTLLNAKISLSSGGNRVFMQILDYCKNLMAQGQLKAGDRLLPERGLSERLGVSRASLREALRTMEMLGLLSVIPGHGTYIQSPNLQFLATFFGLAFSIRPAILEDVFEVRIMLDCEAARLASKRSSQEELASIKSALDRMPRNPTETDMGAQADIDFHSAVVKASKNDLLLLLYEAVEDLLERSHYEGRAAICKINGALDLVARSHEVVFEAISIRDEKLAEKRMRDHFMVLPSLFQKEGNTIGEVVRMVNQQRKVSLK